MAELVEIILPDNFKGKINENLLLCFWKINIFNHHLLSKRTISLQPIHNESTPYMSLLCRSKMIKINSCINTTPGVQRVNDASFVTIFQFQNQINTTTSVSQCNEKSDAFVSFIDSVLAKGHMKILEGKSLEFLADAYDISLTESPIDLSISNSHNNSNNNNNDSNNNNNHSQVENFEYFYKNEFLSDVSLVLGDDKIPAHKMILAKYSKVFRELFSQVNQQTGKEIIEIKDEDYEVFEEILLFMYKENSYELKNEESAFKVSMASHNYKIESLLKKCEDYLSQKISVINSMAYLKLGCICNANNLKIRALDYIMSNAKEISATQSFDNILGDLPKEVSSKIISYCQNENISISANIEDASAL